MPGALVRNFGLQTTARCECKALCESWCRIAKSHWHIRCRIVAVQAIEDAGGIFGLAIADSGLLDKNQV